MIRRVLPQLAALSREVRDTLYLLCTIGWIVLCQSAHLPLWSTAVACVLLLWRGWLTWTLRPLPARTVLVVLLLVTVAAVALQFRTIAGKDAGSTLIVLLLALKTLELRARRDAFVVFFLGFFTLLSHFLYSQSLLSTVGILAGTVALLVALVNAHLPVGNPSLHQSLAVVLRMTAWGAPLMLALFVLFPRFAPLWGLPAQDAAKTGLSADMTVGNIAKLSLDDSIAMRVQFHGAIPPEPERYFRGPVLGRFNGQRWSVDVEPGAFRTPSNAASVAEKVRASTSSPTYQYEVLMQPHHQHWLLLMDMPNQPPHMPAGWLARQTPTLDWITQRPVVDVLRYRGSSASAYVTQDNLSDKLRFHTFVPADSNPRTRALAQQMRADPRYATASAPVLVQAVLERLRTGGYTYTLEPGLTGPHPADTFWFDSKQGFCEHIADAFAVLMRNLGIPARIVTGYQGGEINGIDGMLTVRQSDAHAWTEVWLGEQQGWVRIDPTASVFPARIGSFQRLQRQAGVIEAAVQRIRPDFITSASHYLRNLWDATNSYWNSWILNYTQDRQFDLLKHLGFDSADWRTLVQLLGALAAITALMASIWLLWNRREHDPWLRLLQHAQLRLQRQGVIWPAHAQPAGTETAHSLRTPRQCLHALQQHATQLSAHTAAENSPTPPWLTAWQNWLLALEAWRYAPPPPPAAARQQWHALQRQYRQLPAIPT